MKTKKAYCQPRMKEEAVEVTDMIAVSIRVNVYSPEDEVAAEAALAHERQWGEVENSLW